VRRLRPKSSVAIHLDGVDGQIDAYVRSVAGAIATLGRIGGLPAVVRAQLSPGLLGYLTFSDNGEPVALRGVATVDCAVEPDFAFVGLDGMKLPERRSDVRVALMTRARVCSIDDEGLPIGEPVETFTADMSLGGVLVERRQKMGIGPLMQVELFFGPSPAPALCTAKVARLTITHMGLRFIEMQESARVRIADAIEEQQHRAA
jgi:hypothetical protein